MKIKTFKLFESSSEDYFPSLEEVKDYFYDFTDELDININYFQSGYKYFLKPHTFGDLTYRFDSILKDKSNYIDILNTNLSNARLIICSNNATIENINREKEVIIEEINCVASNRQNIFNEIFDKYFI